MNDLKLAGYIIAALIALYYLGSWAYWKGYGRTPKDVCEPVKVLSTGERRPIGYSQTTVGTSSAITRWTGDREDLTSALTITDCYANIFEMKAGSIIAQKRQIEASIGSNSGRPL